MRPSTPLRARTVRDVLVLSLRLVPTRPSVALFIGSAWCGAWYGWPFRRTSSVDGGQERSPGSRASRALQWRRRAEEARTEPSGAPEHPISRRYRRLRRRRAPAEAVKAAESAKFST
jgi:hypothetical protein